MNALLDIIAATTTALMSRVDTAVHVIVDLHSVATIMIVQVGQLPNQLHEPTVLFTYFL